MAGKPRRKSWQEKLEDSQGLPKVEVITDDMSKRWGTGTVVIPAPREVDEIMRSVPKGKKPPKVKGFESCLADLR